MTYLGLTLDQWIDLGLSALIVLVTAVVGRLIVGPILRRGLNRVVSRTDTTFDDVILEALSAPFYWLVAIMMLKVALSRLDFIPGIGEGSLESLFFVFYFSVAFSSLWRLVTHLTKWFSQEVAPRTETKLDEQLMPFLRRVMLIVLGLIGAIVLLSRFEIDVSGLVTTLGIGSLAIALAAQATVADTISGFVIMFDRPFSIGDRIEIQDLDTWGDVMDIGLRSTRVRTRDNRMVIVPNSVIGKSLIVNYTFPDTQYRIQIHIGVGYGSDIELARKTMIEAIRGVDGVLPDRRVEALFLEFGDSALIFRLRWWIDSYVDTRRMFDKVNTAVYLALNEAEVEIPNPQLDIHHRFDATSTSGFVFPVRTVD